MRLVCVLDESFFRSVFAVDDEGNWLVFFGIVDEEIEDFFGEAEGTGFDLFLEYLREDDERLESSSSSDDSLEDLLEDSDELEERTLEDLDLVGPLRLTGTEEGFEVDFFVAVVTLESVEGRDSLLFRD